MKELELLEVGVKDLYHKFHDIRHTQDFCTPNCDLFIKGKLCAYKEVLELIEHIDSLKAIKEVK